MRLFIYNWIKRPWFNWYARRRYMAEFIADGHSPSFFPRLGRLTNADLRWANSIITDMKD